MSNRANRSTDKGNATAGQTKRHKKAAHDKVTRQSYHLDQYATAEDVSRRAAALKARVQASKAAA